MYFGAFKVILTCWTWASHSSLWGVQSPGFWSCVVWRESLALCRNTMPATQKVRQLLPPSTGFLCYSSALKMEAICSSKSQAFSELRRWLYRIYLPYWDVPFTGFLISEQNSFRNFMCFHPQLPSWVRLSVTSLENIKDDRQNSLQLIFIIEICVFLTFGSFLVVPYACISQEILFTERNWFQYLWNSKDAVVSHCGKKR